MKKLDSCSGASKTKSSSIDTYRERLASVVALAPNKLITHMRDDPTAVIKRKIAAYLLQQGAGILAREVVVVMEKSEAWVCAARNYVKRKMNESGTFRADIEQKMRVFRLEGLDEFEPEWFYSRYSKWRR